MPRPTAVPGRRVISSAKPVAAPTQHPQIAALILDDGTVRRILANDALVASIPGLAPYAAKYKEKQAGSKPKGGCGGCGGGASQQVVHGDFEYNAVRHIVVSSGVDKQNLIKAALNVKQLRVYYLDATGNRARATV